MPYKKDDNGNIITGEGGLPVVVFGDGKEGEFDPDKHLLKLAELNAKISKLEGLGGAAAKKLELYEKDFADILSDPEATRKAIEATKNFNEGDWLKADKVEGLKAKARKDVKDTYEQKIVGMTRDWDEKSKALEIENQELQKAFFTSELTSEIARALQKDATLGKETTLSLEGALRMFSGQFRPEKTAKGFRISAVGWDGDSQIFSTAKDSGGEPASVSEALKVLWETCPFKADFAKGMAGGPGGGGGVGKGEQTDIASRYEEAMKKGDMQAAVALNRKRHELGI